MYSIYNHLYKNPNYIILYTHTDIHHGSIFALDYILFHLINIYTPTIHAELKILFYLPPTPNAVKFIFIILFGTNTRAYGSSIVLQLLPHLLTLTING